MEMLSFDLRGKFAHFRKYYANNTALTFSIPPRTTLMGIVAAILGLPKDSYHRALGPEHLRFGVQALTPLKKSFHRLNLLMIKSSSDFRGQKGRIQTPFEIITGLDLRMDSVIYRVFVMPATEDAPVFQQLKETLSQRSFTYSLTLGTAFCLAGIENIRIDLESEAREGGADFLPISTATPVDMITDINLLEGKLLIEEELLPGGFVDDYNRELAFMRRVLFPIDGNPMNVKISGEYFVCSHNGISEFITLID
jgi:CRISPR-associated protein Cas5h